MLKRTIYIGNPAYLKTKYEQLIIENPKGKELLGSVPIEDMALLILNHKQITLSSPLIEKLMQNTVAIIHCDNQQLPNGLMLPMVGHSELTQRWRNQLNASTPLKKQLWKQTVYAKIRNQIKVLEHNEKPISPMQEYLKNISSGDEQNMEGKAANHYWKYALPNFQRNRYGEPPNNYLNFGYSILRSIVARALVRSGMLTAQGIFHKNKYNPYCLADDIMEPYRPYLDQLVIEYLKNQAPKETLDKNEKAKLLSIATEDVHINGKTRPLFVAVSTTTASLYKCFTGERRTILYPKL